MTLLPPGAPLKDQWTLLRGARQLLTLRGPSGPRRGPSLKELGIVADAALLIRNGVIQEVGTARRIENLKEARTAKVIDAGGGVVMPAFVDPDTALVHSCNSGARQARVRVASRHRLAETGAAAAADWARSGVLSIGAHTGSAETMRDALKILRVHQSLQAKPLRIRSVYCPPMAVPEEMSSSGASSVQTNKALHAIRNRKLAAIVEFDTNSGAAPDWIRQMSAYASEAGYAVRLRIRTGPELELLRLAMETSSICVLAPPAETIGSLHAMAKLGDIGSVHVLTFALQNESGQDSQCLRREIDEGVPIAIGAGARSGGSYASPQFLLYLAVDRGGLTPEEAIMASTYNAACALRMSHTTGTLEPGKSADLLVMDVKDYRDLIQRVGNNDVRIAVKAGQIVYRRGSLIVD